MSDEYTIRPARTTDVERLLVVHAAAIFEHGPEVYTDRQVAAWAAKPEGTDRYLDAIKEAGTEIVVADTGERIAGFGEVDLTAGEIEGLFVDPGFGGQGIGSDLLAHFEDRLRSEGIEIARLRAVRNAATFYEQHGYEGVEETIYETTDGVEAASVRFKKRL